MIERQQIISKGPYVHSQVSKFLSVKQYIFLRKEDQKCLMIKFTNEMDFYINKIKIKLVQLNADGKTICTSTVDYGNASIAPGMEFTPLSRIVVDEKCVDFKVYIDYVDSGNYRYRIKRGKIVAYYNEADDKHKILDPVRDVSPRVQVNSDRMKNRNSPVWLAVIIGIAITFMTVVSCLFDIVANERADQKKNNASEHEIQFLNTVDTADCDLPQEYFGVDYA